MRGVLGGRGLGLRMGEEGGWCWGLLNFAVPASLEFIYIKLCRFHSFPPPLSHTLAWPIEIYFHIFILWNIADRTDQAGWSDRLVRQAGQAGWSGRLVRQAGQAD